jgi:formate dehydrogenase iron-sulfur subunit
MSWGVLVDTTLCTGCRGCQVACKAENGNQAVSTEFFAGPGGYQNPAKLSSDTYSLVTFHEVEGAAGDLKWVFVRRQCMHCLDPACASACLVGAISRDADGCVTYDASRCIGCRYCQMVCPFGVPSLEWEKSIALIRKCIFCSSRIDHADVPDVLNEGHSTEDVLDAEKKERHLAARKVPACVATCPTGALTFGDRDELLVEAHNRIADSPGRYVDHVYGEREAGGTAWLYLASVPFSELGFPTRISERAYPSYTSAALGVVAPQILGVGALLGGFYWYTQRRERVAQLEAAEAEERNSTP